MIGIRKGMGILKVIIICRIIILTMFQNVAFSQCKDWIWPANKQKAQEKMAIFQDAFHAEDYKQAKPPLLWLLSNAPNLNVSLYIRGAELFDGLARAETNLVRKSQYVDTLMLIYDLRVQYCGEKATVLNRKAMAYFKFNINGSNPDKVLDLMDEAFELNGNKIMDVTLLAYMETIYATQLKQKKLSQDEILGRFDNIISIVDFKIGSINNDDARLDLLKKYKHEIEELLLKIVKIDCEFVDSVLVPKYKQNPGDLALAKKIFGYLLIDKCVSDPMWLETGEFIFSKERDFGLAKNLGLQFYILNNYEKASNYFNECLKLARNGLDSADIFVYQGSLLAKKANIREARDSFFRAITADHGHKEAYRKIGDLYYNSFNDCAKKVSMADDRAVYLLAYDYYQKAGDLEKMEIAKNAFPSREEIFLMNYQVGQKISVNCWIGEVTTIRTRD